MNLEVIIRYEVNATLKNKQGKESTKVISDSHEEIIYRYTKITLLG